MKVVSIKDNDKFLGEYIKLCNLEWGEKKKNEELYLKEKKKEILSDEKVISVLGLIDNDVLVGFISLFKYDGDSRRDLTPWYATMYVKKEYRNKGYSKILNDALLKEALRLGYNKVYLKSELNNYYEKFGAIYLCMLDNGEKLYYIDVC